jgi:hypothetical protein
MAQIERRQARIRRIRQDHQQAGEVLTTVSDAANSPGVRYQLGSTQNYPEQISLFLQRHAGDPAIKVSPYYLTA